MHEDLLRDVIAATPLGGHRVRLRFDDGLEADVDLRPVIGDFVGVFAPLSDPAEFTKLRVDPDGGTICWPNGADLDPVVLYCTAKGIPVPSYEDAPKAQRPRATQGNRAPRAAGTAKARGRRRAGA